ncbi:MAG TPA: hypothetical protein VMT01_00885 [Candidatus Acidoferrum sp.]|nr:hypothetical protein [Candidatus Acidoferrum sp.]
MGRIEKGVKCSITGCGKEPVRSLSADKVRHAGLKVGTSEKRAYLCKEHYKEFKRLTKKDKKLEKWRFNA